MAKLVAPTYANALFELGIETDGLKATYEDFQYVNQICIDNPRFLELLTNPRISSDEKKQMLDSMFEKDLKLDLVNFFKILIEKRRFFYIRDIFNEYEKLYNEHFNIQNVVVTSAIELKEDEVLELRKNLEKSMGSKIVIETKVDENLLGGLQIQVGEKLIDATAKKKIQDIYIDLSKISLK